MSCFDPSTSILAGMDDADLRAELAALQRAYLDLSKGAKTVTATYAQGNGNRSVTFAQTETGAIVQAIRLIQAQLGIIETPRRSINVSF